MGPPRTHVLDGGTSLTAPLPGTAGYARLFGQEHGPYRPRSDEVRRMVEQIQERSGADGANAPVEQGVQHPKGRRSGKASEKQ